MSLFRRVFIVATVFLIAHARALAQTPAASPSAAASAMPSPSAAPEQQSTTEGQASPHDWDFSVTPYIWAPNLNGTLEFQHEARTGAIPGLINIDVHVGPNSYLTHLNSAAMLTAEGHNDHWGVFTDFIYMNLSAATGSVTTLTGPGGKVEIPVTSSISTRFSSTVFTLGGELPIPQYSGRFSSFDAIFGARYIRVNASLTYDLTGPIDILDLSGSASRGVTLVDPIFGFRGKLGLGSDQWYIPYYGDIGFAGGNNTWQGVLGFGYHFRGGDIVLVNRWLNYYMDSGLLKSTQLVGPTIGYKIKL